MMNYQIFLFLLLSSTSLFAQTGNDFLDEQLDTYIEESMEAWQIPGLAIGIIQNGELVVAKGYGVRSIASKAPVDKNTLFLIGSNTKAFTGTLAAWLAYEKKLDLDAPVMEYLPWFRMYDPNVSTLISTRDLLAHRSGLGTAQGDFSQWNGNLTREEMVMKMASIKPLKQFRSEYGYCNYCYVAASEVIKSVGSASWETQIQDRIFTPLGMHRSIPIVSPIIEKKNIAAAHTLYGGQIETVDYPNIDYISGAGSIVSSINDLAKWVQLQLDTGRVANQQIIPKEVVLHTWQAETMRRFGKLPHIPSNSNHYGLGFIVADYADERYLYHGGGTDGFITEVSILPKQQLGIIILTNTDASGSFNQALKYRILAELTNQPPVDYKGFYWKTHQESLTKLEQLNNDIEVLNRENTKPALPLEAYTGKYTHPVYGKIEIVEKEEQLKVHFSSHPNFIGTLTPKGGQEFLISYNYRQWGICPASFEEREGAIRAFKLNTTDFIEPNTTYHFVKR